MKKRKSIIIPMMLAAAVAAASVPCSSQDIKASCNTYEVSVAKGYLALRTSMAYTSSNEIGELYSGESGRSYRIYQRRLLVCLFSKI